MASFGYRPRIYGQSQGGYLRPASSARMLSPVTSALAGPSPAQGSTPLSGTSAGTGPFTTGAYGAPSGIGLAPRTAPQGVAPQQTAAPVNPQGVQQNTAPTPGVYDLNTDPALQQIAAFTGMGDQQAQAAALKARQQQLLAYGDPNLAQNLLGDSTFAQAVGQNPSSTLAQLGTQHQRNLTDLTEALNKANLFYGGYRVNQEQQGAQDYQNQLANAAGGVNQNLDTIAGNLAAALGQNQMQRAQEAQAARDRAVQMALASGQTFMGYDANGNPIFGTPAAAAAPAAGPTLNLPPNYGQATGVNNGEITGLPIGTPTIGPSVGWSLPQILQLPAQPPKITPFPGTSPVYDRYTRIAY